MRIIEDKVVATVVDRVCDVCNESVMIEVNDYKYEECGELKAQWGYGSKEDGNTYHLDLCESCFKIALFALRDHRRGIVMFDEEKKLPDEKFGLDPDQSINQE